MNSKVLTLDDRISIKDKRKNSLGPKGHVKIYAKGTNVLMWEGWNKVVVDGSMFTASKHFNLVPPINLPSYNTELALDNSQAIDPEKRKQSLVYLFCVGTSGCGAENSQVYDVDYTSWIKPEDLVPFRYQLKNNDLGDALREKYFGRKEVTALNRVAYYFKAFDADPQFKSQYIDGTPITATIYDSDNKMDVETFVELKLSITKDDCRDFFIAHQGINDAKINTISLCTAYPVVINGITYYQEIRPLTRLNFPNESLIDLTKGIDIIYDLFY